MDSKVIDRCELVPSYIRAIAPYQPGKPITELARELRLEPSSIIKLASNENPLGPSPRALEAVRAALPELALYPDGNGFELKQALVKRYGVSASQIVLGNGSNDILELAARTFLVPGDAAVYSQHAFAVYALVTKAVGAAGIEVPARAFGHDLDAMFAAVTPRTRLVFIANPNNPTGTLLSGKALQEFLRALPAHVMTVLDEAYDEYLPQSLKSASVEWLREFPNLIISRTFSKAYGLAGLRAGFALTHPDIADLMNRVRQPFNVNSLALVAAAAALEDMDFVQRTFELNNAGMQQIIAGLERLGLSYIPSYGNFISFKIKDAVNEGAAGIFQRLLKAGIIVRPIAAYQMPDYLRVSIGLETENARFLEALAQVI